MKCTYKSKFAFLHILFRLYHTYHEKRKKKGSRPHPFSDEGVLIFLYISQSIDNKIINQQSHSTGFLENLLHNRQK